MRFALIGIQNSKYYRSLLDRLVKLHLYPYYVLIEDTDKTNLANSAYFIDNNLFDTLSCDNWNYDTSNPNCIISFCVKHKIPFFVIPEHCGRRTIKVLTSFGTDILLITEGPIIRGEILYRPRLCVMNIHAAPLPRYRGNWTTRLALYNDEPPTVTAHVVTPWIDEGAIIDKRSYIIEKSDTLDDVDKKAMAAAVELACDTLSKIEKSGFYARQQSIWEGKEYKGHYENGILHPAMPFELQEELEKRFKNGEYGFFSP